jgi:hypothetical protein
VVDCQINILLFPGEHEIICYIQPYLDIEDHLHGLQKHTSRQYNHTKTHFKAIQSHKNTPQGNTITQKHTSRQYNHTKTHLKAIQSHKNTPQGNTITQKHTSRQYDHTKTHLKAIRSHKNTPQGNTITQKSHILRFVIKQNVSHIQNDLLEFFM